MSEQSHDERLRSLAKQLWDAVHKIADPSTLDEVTLDKQVEKLQLIACEALSTSPSPVPQMAVSKALLDIAAERRRQVEAEGWTTEHDDEHTDGSMALAAGSYCESAARPTILARKPGAAFAIPKLWPQSWSRDWWKPKSPREDLVRAAALIIAEIDRLDRATATETHADV